LCIVWMDQVSASIFVHRIKSMTASVLRHFQQIHSLYYAYYFF
jgi:hypothetical protein